MDELIGLDSKLVGSVRTTATSADVTPIGGCPARRGSGRWGEGRPVQAALTILGRLPRRTDVRTL